MGRESVAPDRGVEHAGVEIWHQIAVVENEGVENAAPDRMGGERCSGNLAPDCNGGQRGSGKSQIWMQDVQFVEL